MRRSALAGLFVLVGACVVPTTTAAAPVAAIATSLRQLANTGQFSGTVLIAKDGRPIFAHAYGLANRATGERNRLDTRYNLASVGKMFTAVAVGRLVEDGKLSLDDPIGKYLPQLPVAFRALTVAELLDHTSGLGDYFGDPRYDKLQPRLTSLARYLPLIVSTPPVGRPGSTFQYSNSGFILLGLIVEKVSGLDYYTFVRRNVFARAGMTHTGCIAKHDLRAGIAIGYTGATANTAELPPRGTSAGGCYSTVTDLLAFANALFTHRLLDARLTRALVTPHSTVGPHDKYGYGFGIRYGRPGDPPTIWHNGGSPGAGSELDVNPQLGYTVVVLANRGYPEIAPAISLILNRLHVP